MKRALLLTYHVPPRATVASVRVGHLMRTLPLFGWEVVPMTPDMRDTAYGEGVITTGVVDFRAPIRKVLGVRGAQTTHERLGVEHGTIQTRPSAKQRIIRFGYEMTDYANRSMGWLGPGTRAAGELLRAGGFDAIVSSSPPEVVNLVASRVRGALPWVADFRDPWYWENGLRGRNPMLRAIDGVLERSTLRHASALTTVSEPLAALLRARYPHVPVHSIRNAFSAKDFSSVPFRRPARATFLYAGQMYGGKNDPRPLFEALAHLLHEGLVRYEEIAVDFYGDDSDWIAQMIAQFGLRRIVHLHGRRSRGEILELERAATRLLLFSWNDLAEAGTYTGKLFEYLGARRPILGIGGPPESVIDEVLAQTAAGARFRSQRALRDAILSAVIEWRSGCDPSFQPQTSIHSRAISWGGPLPAS